jgi:hypothetical protein
MKALLLILLSATLFSCSSNYSSGWRAGYLNKFSQKGLIYKTWEGSLNLGGAKEKHSDNGTSFVANIWDFSLDAEHQRGENIKSLSDSLNKALELGYRVRLHYNEESLTDWNSNRGSESYYVDSVKILYE